MLSRMSAPEVTLDLIRAARERIAPYVRRTPLLDSELLSARYGTRLEFKCENLQYGGSFKSRGAVNAVFSLSTEELKGGVVAHSSGNHGTAVARAAWLRGVRAQIVMPENSSPAKLEAVRGYGGEVHLCAPTLAARAEGARRIVAECGAAFVHPYDDPRVIAGQGTLALELLEQLPELELLLCPISGGGLASGLAVAARALRPGLRVIGVEPAVADDAQRSLRSGVLAPQPSGPATIADGLRGALSERTFALLRAHVDDIVTVSEAGIVEAMRELWQELHVIVEPSSAVPYAALLERAVEPRGARTAVVLTGGNVALDQLPWQ
jgi:threonine dehydratase